MQSKIIRVGQRVTKTLKITGEAIKAFGDLVGDHNPIHSDPEAAKAAGFPAPICYGAFAGSFFSGVMATDLPGPQTVYLSQTYRFVAPVFAEDEVEIAVELTEFRKSKGLMAMRTTLSRIDPETHNKILCIDGTAIGLNKTVTFEGESEWTMHK